MIWLFIVVAFFLVIGLSLYAIYLLKQLKIQNELITKAKNERTIRLKESIDVIYAYLNPDIKINGYEI